MATRPPAVFIGSSTEALEVAEAVEHHLRRVAEATKWTDVRVPINSSILELLVNQLHTYDFAVMILTPDDLAQSRDETFLVTRDNVIFELGLFMGRLGRERTFIVQEEGVRLRLPSDLGNVITLRYERRHDGNLKAALSVASGRIKEEVASLGIFRSPSRDHTETSLIDKVARLRMDLHARGFAPDLIMGISRGGLAVAALLSRQIGGMPKIPTMALSAYPGFNNPFNRVAFVRETFVRGGAGPIQILIVDDVCVEGKTLDDARSYVESSIGFPEVQVATAALTALDQGTTRLFQPTFVVEGLGEPVERFGGDVELLER